MIIGHFGFMWWLLAFSNYLRTPQKCQWWSLSLFLVQTSFRISESALKPSKALGGHQGFLSSVSRSLIHDGVRGFSLHGMSIKICGSLSSMTITMNSFFLLQWWRAPQSLSPLGTLCCSLSWFQSTIDIKLFFVKSIYFHLLYLFHYRYGCLNSIYAFISLPG